MFSLIDTKFIAEESNGNGKDQRNGVNTDGDGEVER